MSPTPIRWTSEMSVDLSSIDEEHKVLIDLLNRFGEILEHGDKVEDARALFDDIIEHTVAHFDHEERVMRNIGYRELRKHKRQHEVLLENAATLRADLETATDLGDFASVAVFLNHLVLKHMLESDAYIRAHIHRGDDEDET